MSVYASIALCFLPLIITIIITHAIVENFTKSFSFIALLVGFGAILPVAILQFFIKPLPIDSHKTLYSVLISALIFDGLLEETIKMVFISFVPGKTKKLACFLAIGLIAGSAFGCFESVIYLIAKNGQTSIRLLTSVLLHTFCTGLSSICVWSYKQGKGLLRTFITAVFLHGIYNFFAGFSGGYWWFSILTILLAALRCRVHYIKIAEPEK
ncbi:MAG TPA: PrsW family glutamic-type intramembrane protease [Treponemataceae bacterium]|nr:PrsW family glutamic-type intramembrane protease [Treponemataceae bacterium]